MFLTISPTLAPSNPDTNPTTPSTTLQIGQYSLSNFTHAIPTPLWDEESQPYTCSGDSSMSHEHNMHHHLIFTIIPPSMLRLLERFKFWHRSYYRLEHFSARCNNVCLLGWYPSPHSTFLPWEACPTWWYNSSFSSASVTYKLKRQFTKLNSLTFALLMTFCILLRDYVLLMS